MECSERYYPIRLAIALEIGSGGDIAFGLLHDEGGGVWKSAAWPENKAAAQHIKAGPKEGKKQGRHGRNDDQPDTEQLETHEDPSLRSREVCACLTPLLVGSFHAPKVPPRPPPPRRAHFVAAN